MEIIDKTLQGINILNFALNLPGPAAAAQLCNLGAFVTKIEPPDGDPFKRFCPQWYDKLCLKQHVIRLDLKTPEGHDYMEGLLSDTDLFLTSFRPDALERLSLSWKDLHNRHPKLCQVAIVGYPSPDQNRPGHDLNYQATLGLISPPHFPRTLLADLEGAEKAVRSALALLFARERHREAGYTEVALSECAAYFAQTLQYGLTVPGGMLGGGSPRYNLFETRQGWITVAALEPRFWKKLTREFGLDGPDIGYNDLQEAFMAKNAYEWETWAEGLDLPIVAVR